MSSHAALVHLPELDDFLFAAIGEERNGMSLTMVSALGRLGLDPWTEAGRFSEMPKKVAADLLGPMIARLPNSLWALPEAQVIAARLVKLLPQQRSAAVADSAVVAIARKPVFTVSWVLCAALLAAVLIAMAAGRDLSLARFLASPPGTNASTDQPSPGDR